LEKKLSSQSGQVEFNFTSTDKVTISKSTDVRFPVAYSESPTVYLSLTKLLTDDDKDSKLDFNYDVTSVWSKGFTITCEKVKGAAIQQMKISWFSMAA